MEIKAPIVVTIEGHDIALGLHWEDLTGQQVAVARKQLKAIASKHAIRYGVLQEAGLRRYVGGLYRTTSSQRLKPQYSAAAWLAATSPGPSIVIAELDATPRYWVGVVDEGVWIEGDTVGDSATAGAAIAAAIDHFSRREIREPKVIVLSPRPSGEPAAGYPMPPQLSVLNVEFRTWAGVFVGAPPKQALVRQLSGMDARTSWALLGVLGAVALGLVGTVAWMHFEKLREEAEHREWMALQESAQQASAGDLEAERARRKQQAIKEALERYTETPAPEGMLQRCASAAEGLGASAAGWPLVELTCEPTVVRANWRAPGRGRLLALAEHAMRAIEAASPASVRLDTNGAEITADWAMPPLDNRPAMALDAMSRADRLHRLLVTRSQILAATHPKPAPWQFAEPAPADISYIDPALENEVDNPARFVQVPPAEGFREASLVVTGTSVWRLPALPVAEREMTVKRVVIRPVGGGGLAVGSGVQWTMEAAYVVR